MMNSYIISAASVLCFFIIVYIFAQIKNDNSKIDIGWGIGFIVALSSVIFINHSIFELKAAILFLMVLLWGGRLSCYIYERGKGKPEDYRYVEMRKNWGDRQRFNAFYRVFLLQAVLLYVIALPLISFVHSNQTEFTLISYLGLALFLTGFLFEAVADRQMKLFKTDESNKGKIMRTGLWKYSRHPNYFGEMLLWWGIYFYTFEVSTWWWILISPVLLTFLLLKVSGVPMLEKKLEKNPEWESYIKETPAFFPFGKR